MEQLPDSREVKLYMRCYFEEAEWFVRGTNKVTLDKFSELFYQVSSDHQKLYVEMNKGCAKRLQKIKDLVEHAYKYMMCWKENSKEVLRRQTYETIFDFNVSSSILFSISTIFIKKNHYWQTISITQ